MLPGDCFLDEPRCVVMCAFRAGLTASPGAARRLTLIRTSFGECRTAVRVQVVAMHDIRCLSGEGRQVKPGSSGAGGAGVPRVGAAPATAAAHPRGLSARRSRPTGNSSQCTHRPRTESPRVIVGCLTSFRLPVCGLRSLPNLVNLYVSQNPSTLKSSS